MVRLVIRSMRPADCLACKLLPRAFLIRMELLGTTYSPSLLSVVSVIVVVAG